MLPRLFWAGGGAVLFFLPYLDVEKSTSGLVIYNSTTAGRRQVLLFLEVRVFCSMIEFVFKLKSNRIKVEYPYHDAY